jgi:hypothetical protein
VRELAGHQRLGHELATEDDAVAEIDVGPQVPASSGGLKPQRLDQGIDAEPAALRGGTPQVSPPS